jgi:hypothetical protein
MRSTLNSSALISLLLCRLALELVMSSNISTRVLPTHDTVRVDSGRMFDTFGAVSTKEENARLENLGAQLKKEPNSKGYVVLYEGSEGRIRNLKGRACRALRHLVRGKANANQVVSMIIIGGHRATFTVELWIWPLTASDEIPRFQPGLDEKETTIIRGVELTRKCCPSR